MGESYPRRDQARGIWKINDITKNIKEEGTYPQASSQNTAIYSGGSTPSSVVTMDTFQINTAGNAVDFGDLAAGIRPTANAGDFIRCIICGGADPDVNTIQYVNYASKGNTADFGDDQNTTQWKAGGGSNGVRSVWGGGNPGTNTISSLIVQTLGNAVDYGDLTESKYGTAFGTNGNNIFASWSGGYTSSNTNRIETKDITSSGNTEDFGDLTVTYRYRMAANSATKNFIAGGEGTTVIDVFTLGSKGNSVDFGDITAVKSKGTGVSNGVTGVYGGGNTYPAGADINVIESFTMSTFGNTSDFGDLTQAKQLLSSNSNGHGGLQEQSQRAPELYSPTGKVVPRGGGAGQIGLIVGGEDGPGNNLTSVEFLIISTLGNSQDFGNMDVGSRDHAVVSSSTRLLKGGSSSPALSNAIGSIEFSTKGNGADFGDLTEARRNPGGFSNTTRGLFAGGSGTPGSNTMKNIIDYVTIASFGNATDFGDLTSARRCSNSGAGSPTRALFSGGTTPGTSDYVNTIDYVTTGSTGNATDFGDLTVARSYGSALSSSTRAVYCAGQSPSVSNVIDYVTTASTGNATDFGDSTLARANMARLSNSTRGVFASGYASPGMQNVIDFITIGSTGNATDFGDVTTARSTDGQSDSHGGLQSA